MAEVTDIMPDGDVKEIILKNGEKIQTKTIILATGAVHRTLGVPGEKDWLVWEFLTALPAMEHFSGIRLRQSLEEEMWLWRMRSF